MGELFTGRSKNNSRVNKAVCHSTIEGHGGQNLGDYNRFNFFDSAAHPPAGTAKEWGISVNPPSVKGKGSDSL